MHREPSKRSTRRLLAVIGGVLVVAAATAAYSSGASEGQPFKGPTSKLRPYNPNLPAGPRPPVKQIVAYANQSNTGFFLDLQNGIRAGLKGTGIKFLTANAQGDPVKNIQQLNTFLQVGVGVLITAPVASDAAQRPIKLKALADSIGVFSFLNGPALNIASASQYSVGNTQGLAAAKFITANMGGKAKVAYFNADQLSPILVPRHTGAIAGVKTAGPGVEIVADVYNVPSVDGGFQKMNTILQAHPDVNVVFGDDDSVVGALNAIKAAGKEGQVKYMSGINGSPPALALVAAGNTPFKASFGFQYAMIGYQWGKSAAGYLDGKSIPRVILVNAVKLDSPASVARFNAATKNPAKAKLSTYLTLLGNTSYRTRSMYLDYAPS